MGVWDSAPKSLEDVPPLWRWVGAGMAVVTGYALVTQVHYSVRKARSRRRRAEFLEKNRQHKQEFATRIRQIQPGDAHEAICALSLKELQENLQSGTLKPTQVLRAYQRKTVDVNEKTNCVADYIVEAEKWAAELDSASDKGPLHGIPFSVKEIFPLKGYTSTWGNYTFAGNVSKENFALYEVLINQGAVPFVRSNIPYMSFSYTGWNPIYGDHVNPYDPTRHPGGSSGGEATLVATAATPFGIGSDLGGSVRTPSSWCGIVGLKCGTTRLSWKNTLTFEALIGICQQTFGPMTRDVDSAAFVMRHLLVEEMFKADPIIPPVPWRDQIYEDRGPLRIGYFVNNGVIRAVPAMERAVLLTKDKLQQAGHTLVPFQLPEGDGSSDWTWHTSLFKFFHGDGGYQYQSFVGDDVYGDELMTSPSMPFPRLPMWFNYTYAQFVKLFNEDEGLAIESTCASPSVSRWWALVTSLHNWRRSCLQQLETRQIDAVLGPPMPAPAMPCHQHWPNRGSTDLGSYMFVYNILDWTAGVVPVTKVTESDVADMKDYPTQGKRYSMIQEGMRGATGLPVNVQVAAPPYQEELVLRILKQIEESL